MSDEQPTENENVARLLAGMRRTASNLPDLWDGGYWEVTLVRQLADLMDRHRDHLSEPDETLLTWIGGTLFERIKRAAEAEASVRAKLRDLTRGKRNG